MGKYSKSMRAWSEKQLAQFICEVFDREIQRYTGPQGPPGVQGPMGPPGMCNCLYPAPWQTPIISNVDNADPSMLDGGRGYTTTQVTTEITPPLVRPGPGQGFQYVEKPDRKAVYYTCGCGWMIPADEPTQDFCPTHPLSRMLEKS